MLNKKGEALIQEVSATLRELPLKQGNNPCLKVDVSAAESNHSISITNSQKKSPNNPAGEAIQHQLFPLVDS
jgi:hypothetical protein